MGSVCCCTEDVCCCTGDVHAQLTVTWPSYLVPWLVWVQGGAQEAVRKALQGRNSGSQASFLVPQGKRGVVHTALSGFEGRRDHVQRLWLVGEGLVWRLQTPSCPLWVREGKRDHSGSVAGGKGLGMEVANSFLPPLGKRGET